ncbi:pentapeptide repeat-containing protein [Streptosporangium carneum]|uniref:Pentapeptide repeat-containing protein n=1 Tax=Streptosporangium carneum TaxID=47481 RepID=A0A9W6I384_9ACTN|nr:pentapeptide repeat-containing protein [Streptosporangium carneum]GLK11222.1 hypothetical protein GCM10017600_46280 [Streptosporangium carneum]
MVAWAVVAAVAAAGAAWLARGASGPDWLKWTLGCLLAVIVTSVGAALLLGPVARRMAGETRPLTPQDREQLTVKDRVEAVNTARATLLQAATGLVVVGGLVFTGAGLVYTARTLDVSVRTLDATREGQLTDRYTKAVEQLGSSKIDVRLGGIYALERLAKDSARDMPTIVQVLAAYVRVHAHPPKAQVVKGQALVDVAAALNVISVLDTTRRYLPYAFDLGAVDLHGLNLSGANLNGADLSQADLNGADLTGADLTGANVGLANLHDAKLSGARLYEVDMARANLTQADLSSANLLGANLTSAELAGANLEGAVLVDADLTDVRGMTAAQIRAVAKTNAKTTFG